MNGGNDGFNTVVPLDNANLERYRPAAMRISPGSTHRLNGHLGLHPALGKFKSLWDHGQLAIVQGVGYPNQDLSHFNSMAIWMSAIRNGTRVDRLGRTMARRSILASEACTRPHRSAQECHCTWSAASAAPLPSHLASRVSAVRPEHPTGVSIAPFANIADNGQGGWMGAISGTFRDQLDVAQRIGPIMPAQPPGREIVAKLSAAARLINANLGFRVIEVSWADFDSHRAQPTMHTDRMRELDAAVRAFYSLLEQHLVDSGDVDDVLRVRSHAVVERLQRHRPRFGQLCVRLREEREGRVLRVVPVARRHHSMGASAVQGRLPLVLRQHDRRLARRWLVRRAR